MLYLYKRISRRQTGTHNTYVIANTYMCYVHTVPQTSDEKKFYYIQVIYFPLDY